MLVQIDENSATLTPFGSLARHIPLNAPNAAETKPWSELLRSIFSQTRQKRSDEIHVSNRAGDRVTQPGPSPRSKDG
jgi:hypothetical protein